MGITFHQAMHTPAIAENLIITDAVNIEKSTERRNTARNTTFISIVIIVMTIATRFEALSTRAFDQIYRGPVRSV